MNTQKLIAITAGAVFLMGAAAANADTITGSYTVSVTKGTGNAPTLSSPNPNPFSVSSGTGSIDSSINLNTTSAQDQGNLIQINPNSHCGSCGTGDISSATITVTFSSIEIDGYTATLVGSSATDTGTFYADYNSTGSGSETLMQAGDCTTSSGGDDTDCIVWSSANNPIMYTVDTSAGDYDLNLNLVDAQDWDITPQLSFTLTPWPGSPTPTPEPASIVLFLSGLVGLPVIRRRMNRKPAQQAAAA